MRTIACQNLKGGTGKTTTVISIASGLLEKGKKVLILDLDAHENIKESFGINHKYSLKVDILGFLPTFYDPRTKISNEVLNALKELYKDSVLDPVRIDTKIKQRS